MREIENQAEELARQYTQADVDNAKPVEHFVKEDGKMKLKRPSWRVEANEPQVLTEEQKVQRRDYWKTVREDKQRKFNTLEEFKYVFHQTYEYELTPELKNIYDCLKLYIFRDKKFLKMANNLKCATEPNFSKGILLFGSYGVGKSIFLEKIAQTCSKLILPNPIQGIFKSTNSIAKEAKSKSNDYFYHATKGKMILDDLGADRDFDHYGKRASEAVIAPILEERYLRKLTTHTTTNFNHAELGEIYGQRLFDRFYKMFNIFEVKGKSLRR